MRRKLFERILFPWKKVNEKKLTTHICNKTILITGASYGIGEAIAYKLAQKNVTLILVARTSDKLEYLKDVLKQRGAIVYIHATNLQQIEEVDILIDYLNSLPSSIDIFINNAGKSINRSLEKSLDRFHDYTRTMSLNYYAPVKLILALTPMLIKNRGQIINVSTINSLLIPPPFWSAYVASKSAFDNWLRSISSELRAKGVAVTSLYPSLVRTRMIEPTKAYNNAPAISVTQMADIVGRAIISRKTRYAPWWTIWAELGSVICRKPFEFITTAYIKKRNGKE